MRTRADARGYVERRGPTWWLKRRGQQRIRLGSGTELRTRAAARAVADQWLERIRPDLLVPGPRIRAIAYLEQFKKIHLPLMRRTSRAVYRSIIDKHLASAAAGLELVELDSVWLTKLISGKAGSLHRTTLLNIRRVALQVLRQAVKDKYGACRLETRDVKIPRLAKPKKPQRYFKAEEIHEIHLESFQPWQTLWACLFWAGLRAGEGLALRWEDIDFERRLITVRQNAVRGELGAPKTETSAADVPLLPELAQLLREYMNSQSSTGKVSGLLFPSRAGTPYQADDVRRRQLHPVLAALGIAKAGLHAFRHSLPRILHDQGVSVKVISQVMRHGSTAQTETYLHSDTTDAWANLEKAGYGRARAAA